tara:strand:- start:1962 stop:3044 length:1083 start_codon:yes stop_codon:yes gene_type:complete
MHELRLYGPIGGMLGTTAEDLIAQIPEGTTNITLRIHSPGGSVGDGLAMYHALKDHPAHVVTIVDGYAASSASFVMLAGDEIQVHENSLVYVHKPWSGAQGNADEMRKAADNLDKHEQAILGIYMKHTGMSAEELTNMMRDEEFLTGSEAAEMGFADTVIDTPEAKQEIAALLQFGANIEGVHNMSVQKTRKEIQSQLDASIVEVEALKVSAQTDLDEAQALLVASEAVVAERDAEVLALTQGRDEAIADVESGKEIIADATAKVDELTEAAAKHDDQIKAFEMKLSDPAYVDAAKVDAQVDVQAIADAEADAAEANAQIEAEADAPKSVGEAYAAMEQGQARRDFWNDNRRAILNDIKE